MSNRTRFQYWKKTLIAIIFYDEKEKPASLFSSGLPLWRLLLRICLPFLIFPFSLVAWAMLRVLLIRFQVSIYILKPFRPGYASTYLNMMEPLCRRLQHENQTRHIKILVESGADVSSVIVESYAPHFNLYLNDRHKFLRQIFYLVPKSGIEKIFINTSNKYNLAWFLNPAKNFAFDSKQVPRDLKRLDIEPQNFVLFSHASKNYYHKSKNPGVVSDMNYRFFDLSEYELSLKSVLDSNLKVIRIGTNVDELPERLRNLQIVDYTGDLRIESSELWLFEHCKFLISANSGAYWFARKFNRPSLLTNAYAIANGFYSTMFTPMLIQNTNTNSLLTITEMLEYRHSPVISSDRAMKTANLKFNAHSAETLNNAVAEMLNPIDIDSYSSDDLLLLRKYHKILGSFEMPTIKGCTSPAISFLREFSHLVE